MSFIESALRKATEEGMERRERPPVTRRMVKTAVDMQALQRYRTTTLDAEVLKQNLVLPSLQDPGALRGYKILRTRMLQKMHEHGWQSVGVTAVGVGEGKTLTAVNLAFALARDVSTTVFLADLDLQRPRVAACMGLEGGSGLSDYLNKQVPADQIAVSPAIAERLAIIPNFTPIQQSSDAISTPRMLELLSWMRSQTPPRMIICDLPPLLSADDVLAVAPYLDCMLLVVAEGVTPRGALSRVQDVLKGMNLLGVVLNHSSEQTESGYYYY